MNLANIYATERLKEGKLSKIGKFGIINGRAHCERVVYYDEEDDSYYVKIKGEFVDVYQIKLSSSVVYKTY